MGRWFESIRAHHIVLVRQKFPWSRVRFQDSPPFLFALFPEILIAFRVVGRAPRYAHAGRRRDSQGEVCNPGLLSWRRTLGHKITADDMEVPGINNKILS